MVGCICSEGIDTHQVGPAKQTDRFKCTRRPKGAKDADDTNTTVQLRVCGSM
jgi:hypothetical protein